MYFSQKYLSLMLQTFGVKGHPKTSTSAIAKFLCSSLVIARVQSDTIDLSAHSAHRKEFEKVWANLMGEGKDNSIRSIAGMWDAKKPKSAGQILTANFFSSPLRRAAEGSSKLMGAVPSGKNEVTPILSKIGSAHPKKHPLLSLGLPIERSANYWGVKLHQDWKENFPQHLTGNKSFPVTAILSVLARYVGTWKENGRKSVCENLYQWLESNFSSDVHEFLRGAILTERAAFEEFLKDAIRDGKIYSEKRGPLPIIQNVDPNIAKRLRKKPQLLAGVNPRRKRIYPTPLNVDKLGGKKQVMRLSHENYTEVLRKIEFSTQEHQEMLGILTRFLRSHFPESDGYSYVGNGCDLLMVDPGRTFGLMVEIKTTSRKNFISQVRAAIGQLADYWVSVGDSDPNSKTRSLVRSGKMHLVAFIQNPTDWREDIKTDSLKHAVKMFERCNLHVIFMDTGDLWKDTLLALVQSLGLPR